MESLNHSSKTDSISNIYDKDYFNICPWYYEDDNAYYCLANMIATFQPNTVIDIGCGFGKVVKFLKEVLPQTFIVGIDGSDYCISKTLIPGLVLKVDVTEHIPFEKDYFDVVFSSELLEHIPENHIEKTIEEMARIGKKWFLFTINTFDSSDPTHITLKEKEWWMNKFNKSGLMWQEDKYSQLANIKNRGWDLYVFRK